MASKPRRRYDPKQIAEALTKSRGLVSLAAQMVGCGVTTIYDHMERNPEVAKAAQQATSAMLDVTEARLFQAINDGQSWAIMFYLARKGKERGYSERQELTGANGGPVETAKRMVLVFPGAEAAPK